MKIKIFERCPLSKMGGGQCRFAWHYGDKVHCFYACGDVVVSGKNMRCPFTLMTKKVAQMKLARLKMARAQQRLAEMPADEATEDLPLTEGTHGNIFA